MPEAHILLIEDDQDIVDALGLVLAEKGYSLTSVGSPDEMETAIDDQLPDLILLDIWVGGNDGREAARRLKSDQRTRHAPIIVLSANLSTPQIAKDVKADDFILKPFDIEHLVSVVDKHLKKVPKAKGQVQK